MPKLYLDNTYIFLTTPTFLHKRIFDTNEKKKIILNQFTKVQTKFNLPFYGYSIVDTHYHNLFGLEQGENIGKVIQLINGGSSFLLNKLDGVNRNVWDNRWLRIVNGKKAFYLVLGYIIGNALKHGVVKSFEELKNYPFSSFKYIADTYGDEFAQELVLKAIRFDLENEREYNRLFGVKAS